MSRHRDVRNMAADDYEDDYSSYGSSYGSSSYVEDASLSTSMENYMFRRLGSTPKMSHFVLGRSDSVPEEDEGDDEGAGARRPIRPRSDSETSSNGLDDLDEDSRGKLAKCLEEVLDVVGDTMSDQVVKEAIVRCDFNSEVALNTLLNNPVGHRGIARRGGGGAPKEKKLDEEDSLDDSLLLPNAQSLSTNASSAPKPISTPSTSSTPSAPKRLPNTTNRIPTIQTLKTTGAKPTDSPGAAANMTAAAALTPLSLLKKPNSARSRSQSPAVMANDESSTKDVTSTPNSSVRVAMRKAKIDASAEYEKERGKSKSMINMVVVGHVDSGKSTLMGHLLFRLGSVSSKVMHKYEQESKKLGKQSFAYAWVLDESSEERERGITMDVGCNRFETKTKNVTLLDAPGHKDFIPNMIIGAYQADVAILVVNATRGEFEAGFDSSMGGLGQTREHAMLVRSLGVAQLIVAVNKLDTVNWVKDRFDDIVNKLKPFLKQIGFKESDVTYVPCSGFTGDNLIQHSDNLSSWYSGPTLLECIDDFRPPTRLVDKPFRMSVSDVYKPQSLTGFCVGGRLEAGFVQREDKVLILPLNEIATVRNVINDEQMTLPNAFAGDHVSLVLVGPDQSNLAPGMVICDPANPIPVTKKFRARIVVFNIDVPITKGFNVVLHYGGVQVQAVIKKLVAQINKSSGEILKTKPRFLGKNCNAIVEVGVDSPICIELYSNVKELGRFMMRVGGKTVAAGLVTDII